MEKDVVLNSHCAIRRKLVENYWWDNLSDELPGTVLSMKGAGAPQSAGDDSMPKTRSERALFRLPESLNESIREKCHDSPLAIYIFFLGGLMGLVNRYTKNEEIIIGTPTFKKKGQNAGSGFLFVRNSVSPNQTFSQFFAATKQKVLEACNYQEHSFPALFKGFEQRGRRFQISGISDIAFYYETAQNVAACLKDFPLAVTLRDNERNFNLEVDYDSLRYPKDFIDRFFVQLITFASNALADTKAEISRINILSEQEARLLIQNFNNTDKNFK